MAAAEVSATRPFPEKRAAVWQGGIVLNVEASIYALTLLAGLALRLGGLSWQPLYVEEGLRASAAWQLVQGGAPQFWREPLVEMLAALSFFLFGDNDFMARLAPALAGTALTGLPWLLRGAIGRGGALISAAIIALSPSFVFYSRYLSGDIFAAVLAVLLVALGVDWLRNKSRRSLLGASLVLALLLNTGGAAIWYVLLFLAYAAVGLALGWWDMTGAGSEKREAGRVKSLASPQHRRLILNAVSLFLGAFLLTGSGFFLNTFGLGFPAPGEWIKQFGQTAGGLPWYYSLLVMIAYEPLATLFGIMGAVYLLRNDSSHFHRLLALWAGVGFVMISLTGSKSSAQILVLILPLCLLAGAFLSRLRPRLEVASLRRSSYFLVPAVLLLGFTVIGTSFLSRGVTQLPSSLWWVSGASIAAVVGLIVGAAYQGKWQGADLSLLLVLGLAFLFTVHTIWGLNYRTSPAEWFASAQTSGDSVRLVRSLGPVLEGKEKKVAVDSRLAPTLGWYLKDKQSVYYVDRLIAGEAVLIALDDRPLEGMESYTKQRRTLKISWFPEGVSPEGVWRWLMMREAYGPARSEAVAVYQRK
ncbi:MAG: TIGR03663 family protein [Chloroflexi bacterium]|nr:TIGR03663 family protein [Chloroflexota bacterium]